MRSREHIRDLADEQLAAKQAEVGEEDWKTVERLVLIRTIDSLWVEHLTELDDMRRGIGLRGYAQQDPLNEFKREAFQLYDELRGLIRHGVASSIFRVTVTRQPARHGVGDPAVAASLAAGSGSARPAGTVPTAGPGGRPAGEPVASRPMRVSRRLPPPEGRPSCAAARPRHPPLDRCAPRSAISRSPATVSVRPPAAAARSPGSRPAAHGSGATIRAGAVPARSTRSVTGAEPGAAPLARPSTLKPRSLLRDLLKVGLLACLAIVLVAGYATFRVWAQGERDDRRPADAIVVLGAAQYDGRPSPLFRARLDHAVELYQAGIAPRLVLTGGKASGDRTTEAASARDYAILHGVPAEAILMDENSRTTLESIRAVGGAAARERSRRRGLRLGSAAHAAGPADGRRRRHRGLGVADLDQPDRARSGAARSTRRCMNSGALAQYFLIGSAS